MPQSKRLNGTREACAATLVAAGWAWVSMADALAAEPCGFSVEAIFTESAPTDRFEIRHTSNQSWQITSLSIDMSASAGNLIFDVTATGAGVDVFQPFVGEAGSAQLGKQPKVSDGDQVIDLVFSRFAAGTEYRFSIDVDDQLTRSRLGQTRIDGSEIQGASMTLQIENTVGQSMEVSATFDDNSRIQFSTANCQN